MWWRSLLKNKTKILNFSIIFLIIFSFIGCEKKIKKPMVLAANLWVGYAPLYYAEQKGWLDKNGIKFVATLTLKQSLEYYKKGSFDVFAGTNYEFNEAKKVVKDLMGIKLLDISKNGDLIYSNRTIDELKASKKIDAYLEIDSVNSILLEKFIAKYKLKKGNINFINKKADSILRIKMKDSAALIVTYKPYNRNLKKIGYKVVSTAQSLKVTVVDALFASKNYDTKHMKKIEKLNQLFDVALEALKNNPYKFYIAIKPYFGYKEYKNFQSDMKSVKWQSEKSLNALLKQSETK